MKAKLSSVLKQAAFEGVGDHEGPEFGRDPGQGLLHFHAGHSHQQHLVPRTHLEPPGQVRTQDNAGGLAARDKAQAQHRFVAQVLVQVGNPAETLRLHSPDQHPVHLAVVAPGGDQHLALDDRGGPGHPGKPLHLLHQAAELPDPLAGEALHGHMGLHADQPLLHLAGEAIGHREHDHQGRHPQDHPAGGDIGDGGDITGPVFGAQVSAGDEPGAGHVPYPSLACSRYALMKPSRSPSITACTLPVSWPVRPSLTRL